MEIKQLILQHLPAKRRTSPQGWIVFNAPCCHHRGHRADTRSRGNVKFSEDGTIGGNCYNCNFKFRFDGEHLSDNFANWLTWLGVERSAIQAIKLQLLAQEIQGSDHPKNITKEQLPSLTPMELPADSENILTLLDMGCDDPDFLACVEYLAGRGEEIFMGHEYYWSPQTQHQMKNRILIPFYHNTDIVGYTGRYAGSAPPGVPKYYNSQVPSGYLFNHNILQKNRQFVMIVEGPFDAIAAQSVAALGSTLSDLQILAIVNSDQTPIILPDRQGKNQHLIDIALEFGWYVSFPDWEAHVKDAADACKAYGQIYTITSALAARTQNPIEIGLKRKLFQG
jgi:hypothetical protein